MSNHPCTRAAFGGCDGRCIPCRVQQININERQAAFDISRDIAALVVVAVFALGLFAAVAVKAPENWRATQIQNTEA